MGRARSQTLTNKIVLPKSITPGWAEKQARKIFIDRVIFNPAENHRKSDELMEEILIRHGYHEMVTYIRAQERWYE